MPDSKPILVEVIALVEEENSPSPIIVLHDKASNRILPIWIGDAEARAIAVILNNMVTARPLTHQLLMNTIKAMGGKLASMIVDRMEEHTYYATLYVEQGQNTVTIDSRPSDGIALALLAHTPIFVEKSIMDAAGQANSFPVPPLDTKIIQQDGPRKIQLSKKDIDRMTEMLKKAREREEQSS